jgi:hypothetical protein
MIDGLSQVTESTWQSAGSGHLMIDHCNITLLLLRTIVSTGGMTNLPSTLPILVACD